MSAVLKPGSFIFLDTNVFIYHLESDPGYISITRKLFRAVESRALKAATSVITLAEILVRPYKLKNFEAVVDYQAIINRFPNLAVINIGASTADGAAFLSAKYGFAMPDAIQLSCALIIGAKYFITNDLKLKKVKEIKVIALKDL